MKKIIKYISLFFSCLIPKSPRIFVFGSWLGKRYSDNPWYLFLAADKRPEIRAVWITRDKDICRELRDKGYEAYMYNSLKGSFLQMRAGYVFYCVDHMDVNASLIGRATIINLWHGIPLKKILHDDKYGYVPRKDNALYRFSYLPYRKEYVVSSSDTITEIYLSAFRTTRDKIIQLGQPRNDVFYSDETNPVREEFGFDGKIILYMPTHRNEGATDINCNTLFDLKKLDEFCKKNNCLFLIKKHFYHRNDTPADLTGIDNIRDITSQSFDSQLLLKAADILITDYSSCYIDYLLLDRPIVYYNYDMENYLMNDREMYFPYDTVTPGFKATDFTGLMGCLTDVIEKNLDDFSAERARVRDIMYAREAQQPVSALLLDRIIKGDIKDVI